MSKPKHTPGPWRYKPATANHRINMYGDDGRQSVCFDVSGIGDAQLIAAAPCMLEALELALENHVLMLAELKDLGAPPKLIAAFMVDEKKIETAIKKARGE